MIKSKIKFINLLLTFSCLLFIFSCSSDTPTSINSSLSAPITLDGEWTSGSISYHADESSGADCSGSPMESSDFTNLIITSNIEMEAGFDAVDYCEENADAIGMGYDECVDAYTAENIENGTTLTTGEDMISYQNMISYNYEYGDMTLTLIEGNTNSYVISYDGSCIKTDEYVELNEAGCSIIEDAEWIGTECVMTSYTSCEEIAQGDWDAASTGLWYEVSDGNYILDNFLENTDPTTLVFDGTSVYIVLDSHLNQCICGDDAIEQEYGADTCVNSLDDCIFLERYCVSLSFSK